MPRNCRGRHMGRERRQQLPSGGPVEPHLLRARQRASLYRTEPKAGADAIAADANLRTRCRSCATTRLLGAREMVRAYLDLVRNRMGGD